ncbi:1-aminocyclopropane-1-carboxylate deaminase [Thiosulfativibrio zosterae]|uniref:1-aminocyclopropane-1-carboxylate deaminase n=2 Tax=Thiosulfativibrio zosterae TaxID=2675053 RepID=A0A6F8PNF0_9GAMM|nr:1-aminocyclopropane-1-carboxylate deaminase [Thiosulfativibrio zosterae]
MLKSPLFEDANIEVFMKRDDLNHPEIQGNKWHKLKFNLEQAKLQNKTTLLTFGGAYSNHIAATAAAAKLYGFSSMGFIRGDELQNTPSKWSHTLKTAHLNGMQLHFLSRTDYRLKSQLNFQHQLQQSYPDAWIIPEGGSNDLAIAGLQTLATEIDQQCPNWTHLITAVGTGATLSGLVRHLKMNSAQTVLGVATLGSGDFLKTDICRWIQNDNDWVAEKNPKNWAFLNLENPIRYGKITPEIELTQQQFRAEFDIVLDPIYTAKMVLGFYEALSKNRFPPNSKIILLHTGGLQGLQTLTSDPF